jgi:hypothetical protein
MRAKYDKDRECPHFFSKEKYLVFSKENYLATIHPITGKDVT